MNILICYGYIDGHVDVWLWTDLQQPWPLRRLCTCAGEVAPPHSIWDSQAPPVRESAIGMHWNAKWEHRTVNQGTNIPQGNEKQNDQKKRNYDLLLFS